MGYKTKKNWWVLLTSIRTPAFFFFFLPGHILIFYMCKYYSRHIFFIFPFKHIWDVIMYIYIFFFSLVPSLVNDRSTSFNMPTAKQRKKKRIRHKFFFSSPTNGSRASFAHYFISFYFFVRYFFFFFFVFRLFTQSVNSLKKEV